MNKQSNIAAIGHNAGPEGIDAVIAALKAGEDVTGPLNAIEAAQDQEIDLETVKGRKDIASRAYAISKLKTEYDNVGKSLVSEWKQKAKVVDATRATIRNRLDEIRDKVRQPLSKWESDEGTRKSIIIQRLAALDVSQLCEAHPSDKIKAILAEIEATPIDDSWQEYQAEAKIAKATALKDLSNILYASVQRETDRAELDELRPEKIRRDAAEQKRLEAENALKLAEQKKRDEVARLERMERDKEVVAKIAAEKAVKAAEAETKRVKLVSDLAAERQRKEAEQLKAALKQQAAEAKAHEKQAVEAERKRMSDERRAEQAALEKRKADKACLERINAEISKAIATFVEDYEVAVEITDAIFDGKIPHLEVKL